MFIDYMTDDDVLGKREKKKKTEEIWFPKKFFPLLSQTLIRDAKMQILENRRINC